MQLKPQHLLTFVLVAQVKSITKAAQQLHIGQPAVSGQLRSLQETVGEPLYNWRGQQIELTPAGEGLLRYALGLARQLELADNYVHRLQHIDAGALRIGSTVTIGSYYLPAYLVKIQALYPGLKVTMTTADSEGVVQALNNLDLGFIEGEVSFVPDASIFEVIPWQQDEIVMVLRNDHPLASQYPENVPLKVFAEYPVIWREPGSGARNVIQQAFAEAELDVPVNIEVSGVAGIKACVRAGLGISYASNQALKHGDSSLTYRRIGSGLQWQLNILMRTAGIRSRAAQAFLELLS